VGDNGMVARAEESKVSTNALRILGLIASRKENEVLGEQFLLLHMFQSFFSN
jgi:hypothetical protein